MNIMWKAAEIRDENAIEYEHRSNVLPFPNRHAQANAAYSAQLLEADRRATRMAEIEELLQMYQTQRDSLNGLIFTLENEHELLRQVKS